MEQNAKLALNVAPYAYVMENGRIVMDDTAERLRENPDIKDFYLGLTDKRGQKEFPRCEALQEKETLAYLTP